MKSIKVKLLVAIITLFVVTLAALAGLNYWQAKKILTKDIEVEITNLVQNSGKEIGMWLAGTVTEMAAIARSPISVSGNLKEVETISREILSQAQTVSAATEEQSASMEEIASSSQNLAELAEQLQNVVSRFKV
ncbi:hypothetical protein SPSIL_047510 [Sporomusa silvacetica DSM 10669]|uniref:Uncharacterized protein n=1 Tax=Sporomusa silvacetica DSM 10669 TaxID=1123289 RepID=A0ABZ3IST7_9FIRM|nr:hypothetical protein [Sporomusa silvacetica]OZC14520.1 methyl-accepting chemotaxis protein McpA [Sporomusa silvacetica DSM 10669]